MGLGRRIDGGCQAQQLDLLARCIDCIATSNPNIRFLYQTKANRTELIYNNMITMSHVTQFALRGVMQKKRLTSVLVRVQKRKSTSTSG